MIIDASIPQDLTPVSDKVEEVKTAVDEGISALQDTIDPITNKIQYKRIFAMKTPGYVSVYAENNTEVVFTPSLPDNITIKNVFLNFSAKIKLGQPEYGHDVNTKLSWKKDAGTYGTEYIVANEDNSDAGTVDFLINSGSCQNHKIDIFDTVGDFASTITVKFHSTPSAAHYYDLFYNAYLEIVFEEAEAA